MITVESTFDILSRRGIELRRKGSAFVAKCPLHADSKPSLRVWRGKDGQAVISCFPCAINDHLPRFLCRLDGKEPMGRAWAEVLTECGLERPQDGIIHKPREKVWPECWQDGRADIPIALSLSPADLETFIVHEVNRGAPRESPYVQKLIAGVRWMSAIARAKGAA